MRAALLALPLLLSLSQTPQPKVRQPALSAASIDGQVVQFGADKPVPHAQVLVTRSSGNLADSQVKETDSDGLFRFSNIAPGTYRLFVESDGYARAEFGQRAAGRPGAPVDLVPGQKMMGVVVPLTRTGAIYGRILDPSNEPSPNVRVKALKAAYGDEGERTFRVVAQAHTNDLGEYRLFGLVPGIYFLSANSWPAPSIQGSRISSQDGPNYLGLDEPIGISSTSFQRVLNSGDPIDPKALAGVRDQTVYYPGTIDAASATSITLRSGESFRASDFRTARGRGVSLRGQVVDGEQPPASADVRLVPDSASGSEVAAMGIFPQGHFEFPNLFPGVYAIMAANDSSSHRARAKVVIASADLDVRIVLGQTSSIKGRIVLAGTGDLPPIRVQLQADTTAPFTVTSARDGTFMLAVSPGDYTVKVMDLPKNIFVKSVMLGKTDLLNASAHIGGETPEPLEIVLDSNPASVDVLVLDANQHPSTGATVAIVPNPDIRRLDLYRSAITDLSGHVHIDGVAPGDYTVFAWDDIEPNAWKNPDVLRIDEARGIALRVGGQAGAKVQIQVIEGSR